MSEGEGKYHKQCTSTVASKTLLPLVDSDEVEEEKGSAER
jgi:hypothetical protein